ncbi:MAG: leucyl aminopeptidase [Alphaproteobacteria bacterium]|nr:leucyl aminopeptidase [Alphaproteobacteria bacterium]
MSLTITFSKNPEKNTEAAILCFYQGREQGTAAKVLNYALSGFVDHILLKSKTFKAKHGQCEIVMLPDGAPYTYAVLLGLGDADAMTPVEAEKAGGKLCAALQAAQIRSAEFYIDSDLVKDQDLAVHLAAGLKLRSYKFDLYKKAPMKAEDRPDRLELVRMVLSDCDKVSNDYFVQNAMIEGVFLARDLVNEPPNELYPDSYAKRIKAELKPLGVDVEIFDDKKMKKMGMGALLAVGQGSDFSARLVVMRWRGVSGKTVAGEPGPVALVGKGVTFDTGGISLKPGAGMDEMKMDMGGSAAVVGAMKSLALRKSKADVVGVVGLVENMPSARAYRPADIVTSYAGKTIEVLNTDAEGRLVLADALAYVQQVYKPRLIVDLATLTGAMIVALGHEFCGTFATDDVLWDNIARAGAATGEKVWRMPLDPLWKEEMESAIADVQNMAKSGRDAGSCTAAGFLWHFIEDGTAWAHMDIAGTAWIKADKPVTPKYGTGFGVRLLDRMIAENYEQEF